VNIIEFENVGNGHFAELFGAIFYVRFEENFM